MIPFTEAFVATQLFQLEIWVLPLLVLSYLHSHFRSLSHFLSNSQVQSFQCQSLLNPVSLMKFLFHLYDNKKHSPIVPLLQ